MDPIQTAAQWISGAKGLVILSGAGMGVDSGLPDFRGDQGFWQAYPHYEKLGIRFQDAANPNHFEQDPLFGWGFYAHRLNLYRKTEPYRGFFQLQSWAKKFNYDAFAVTSNVDGQFQKAGFSKNQVLEVHGSIHRLQCTQPCSTELWDNEHHIKVSELDMRAEKAPECVRCGLVARPNILMFGDPSWVEDHTRSQEERFSQFVESRGAQNLLAIEIGAGMAVPTIRLMTERLARQGVRSIRINPIDAAIKHPNLSIQLTGKQALEQINRLLLEA